MINLSKIINNNTFVISDTHFGHARMLQFEPVRIKILAQFNPSLENKCEQLITLLNNIPEENHRSHVEINNLSKDLIPFHDEMIISKWNSVVTEYDTVLHLGDFAFRNIEHFTQKLNGKKILLRGNHDRKTNGHYTSCGWKEVIDTVKLNLNGKLFELTPDLGQHWNGLLTKINNIKILFSHFPIYNSNDWDLRKYGHITKMLQDVYEGYDGQINIHGHVHSLSSAFESAINVSIEHTNFYPLRIGDLLKDNGCNKK